MKMWQKAGYWGRIAAVVVLLGGVACGDDAVENGEQNDWNIGDNQNQQPNGENHQPNGENQQPNGEQNANDGQNDPVENTNPPLPVEITEVTVEPAQFSLHPGERRALTATVYDETGETVDGLDLSWESDDESVATVDDDGTVTGVDEGSATVTVSVAELSDTAEVTVFEKTWRQIVAGGGTSCGVDFDGDVYCWGSDFHGASGQPGEVPTLNSEPVPVALGISAVGVTVGALHYCAWDEAGQTYCWGFNQFGQAATAPSATTVIPSLVDGQTFSDVQATGQYSCGLTYDGEIHCWGSNHSGELGAGEADFAVSPVHIPFEEPMVDVGMGHAHACGVSASGDLYCWGRNHVGAVDPGVIADQILEPTEVDLGETVVEVVAGATTTCALTDEGEVVCWGFNARGELGRDVPLEAIVGPGVVETEARFVQLSLMGHSICGLTTDDEVFCWGENRFGAMADGSFEDRSTPVAVGGAERWTSVSAGNSHVCGLDAEGDGWCWGSNAFGEAGDQRSLRRMDPEPVEGEELRFDGLVSGNFNLCGFEHEGDGIYCWGRNEHFQHQTERPGHVSEPQPLSGWVPDELVLGDAFACGIEFDDEAGEVQCWGSNGQGRLGVESAPWGTADPVAVDSNEEFAALDAGNIHACAVSDANEIYCWGGNDTGQVGSDAGTDQMSPQLVDAGESFVDVATGLDHSCGLTDEGALNCWGANEQGQLGQGSTSATEGPGEIDYEDEFVDVEAGNHYTCGRTDDGEIACWGIAMYFTGVPGATFDDEPLVFEGEWKQLEAGPAVVCAIDDEELYCAGWDADGWIAGNPDSPVDDMTHVDVGHDVEDVVVGPSYVCTADTDGVAHCFGHDAWGILGDGSAVTHLEPVRVAAP